MVKRVSIQDISLLSGTSPSTVSRVLNGTAGVSPDKREAVERAIQHLNYRPNHIARSLKTNITYSIGLLLNDITNPFYSAIVRGAEEEALRTGYSLFLCNTNEDSERELRYLQVLQDKLIDGIILGPTGHNEDYLREVARRTPLVQVDRQIDDPNLSAVLVDNFDGAYRATQVLIENGHQRIAVFKWSRQITTMVQRFRGYERAMSEAGLSVEGALTIEVDGLTSEDVMQHALELLQSNPRPTAILALNNQLGVGLMSAAQQLSLNIPNDLALIVFDDLDLFDLLGIASVRQPAFMLGEQSVRLLLRQIQEEDQFTPEVIMLPTELVLRKSVSCNSH